MSIPLLKRRVIVNPELIQIIILINFVAFSLTRVTKASSN